MIERRAFGQTGFVSTRILFGAAALAGMKPARVEATLAMPIARRRWKDDAEPHFSGYEPIRDPEPLQRAVAWVLSRAQVFLNSSSDGRLLEQTLETAAAFEGRAECPSLISMRQDLEAQSIEPLFVRGLSDSI